MVQPFKATDELEERVRNLVLPTLELMSSEKDEFFSGAYESFNLGDVLYNLRRGPLAGDISQEVYRSSYFAIYELFTRPGTFEFYLHVFRALFGESVDVQFTVPSPGVLLINVEALDILLSDILGRDIVNNAYEYIEVIDHDGNNIAGQGSQGPKTQTEMDAIMIEIKPHGIWVQTSLVIS